MVQSHPAWGAWIEISIILYNIFLKKCRTPHGVRGLKYIFGYIQINPNWSHPAWGAWIEIEMNICLHSCRFVAPRMGCVD